MGERVTYEDRDGIVWIHMDDGKANVVNAAMLAELSEAFAKAEHESARAVVLAGRLGFFSAGLDLKTLPLLPPEELRQVVLDFGEMALRLVRFPRPVIALSCGHALAAGAVLMLACDWRVGCAGSFRYGLNEVAINLPLPSFICELARSMLDPRWLHRTAGQGLVLSPEEALQAGYVDELCPPEEVVARAAAAAQRLADLPEPAFSTTKRHLRSPILRSASHESMQDELTQHLALAGLPIGG